VFGGVLGVQATRVVGRSELSAVEVPEAEPAPLPSHPCAGVEPRQEVEPVVHEVCRLIRDDHFNAADMLWEREYSDRQYVDGPALGEDVLTVASTFLDRAEILELEHPSRALLTANKAHAWALRAATRLGHDDPRVEDVMGRSRRIIAAHDG
jgi:hypothetical protein